MKGGLSGQAAPSGRGRGAPGPGPFRGRRAGHRVGTPAGAAAAEQQADSICLGRRPRSAPGEGSSPGEALPQGSCSPRRSAARATPTARARVSGSSRAPPKVPGCPGEFCPLLLLWTPPQGQPGGSPGAWGLGGRAGGGGPEWWLVSSLSRGWPEPAGAKVAPRRPGTDGAPVQGWTARGACPLAAVGTDSGTSLPSPPAPPCLPEASPKQSSMGRGEGPPSQPVGTRARRPSGPGVPKRRLLLAAGVRQLQAPVGSRARPPTLPRSRCAGRMVSRAHAAS